MKKNPTSEEELKAIRQIMEESTKFLSLSGFSGVFIGLLAIAGALVAHYLILDKGNMRYDEYFGSLPDQDRIRVIWLLIADALSVLLLSLATAFFFSLRKGKKEGRNFWTPVSGRLFISLLIPLATGAAFVIVLLMQNHFQLIIPALLIFYGLSLVNAGKFTYSEVFYLGILEIITGLVSSIFAEQWLIFWIMGFGIIHIIYGLFMYRKYEA
jgi:hypothetical protein